MLIPRHYREAALGCAVVFILVTGYLLLSDNRQHPLHLGFSVDDSPFDFLDQARRELLLDLTPTILYSRRCIKPNFSSSEDDRQEVTSLQNPLLVPDQAITLQTDRLGESSESLPKCTPISFSVAKPSPIEEVFPELMFGMATSYERLRDALPSISHWSSNRGSRILIIVEDLEVHADDARKLQQEYRDNGVRATFMKPLNDTHTMSQSHFSILTEMVKASGPETKWFGLLDDDTFFPHLKPLSQALGRMDHTSDMYVGALAEDFGSVTNFGLMAYGGAGIYLSEHLAKKIGALDLALRCIDEAPSNLGDIIIRDCVYHHTKAKVTILPGLYQHDLLGDMSGFFESGVEPLSLHHWKSWYHEPVVKMAAATRYCGNCFLQRWKFGQDTILSNGYSIVKYRYGLEEIDLNKMEHTWNQVYGDHDPKYDFTIGPLREKVREEDIKRYKLIDTKVSNDIMKQLYLWKGNHKSNQFDEVVELVWQK